jgi:hypothetical protein
MNPADDALNHMESDSMPIVSSSATADLEKEKKFKEYLSYKTTA